MTKSISPKAQFIAFDTETGGLYGDFSLLTFCFQVLDENFNVIDELDVKVRPDDGIYKVTAGALKVNKIDLVEHDKDAKDYSDVLTAVVDFLHKHSRGINKLMPIGQNVPYDLEVLHRCLIDKEIWDKFIGYQALDTQAAAIFLRKRGDLPAKLSCSLSSLAQHFGIPVPAAHTAKGDVETTIAVLKAMLG